MGVLKKLKKTRNESLKAPLLIQAFMVGVAMVVNTIMIPWSVWLLIRWRHELKRRRLEAEEVVDRINRGFEDEPETIRD